MALDPALLPEDIAALKAMLIAANRHARDLDAEIENLKLTIAKLQHERFGPSSETRQLCGVDPRAWLDGVLARIADRPASKRAEVLLAAGVHTGAGHG